MASVLSLTNSKIAPSPPNKTIGNDAQQFNIGDDMASYVGFCKRMQKIAHGFGDKGAIAPVDTRHPLQSSIARYPLYMADLCQNPPRRPFFFLIFEGEIAAAVGQVQFFARNRALAQFDFTPGNLEIEVFGRFSLRAQDPILDGSSLCLDPVLLLGCHFGARYR